MTSEEIMRLAKIWGGSSTTPYGRSREDVLREAVDSLVADLERHKRAVAEQWKRMDADGFCYCAFCESIDDYPDVKHAADCVTGLR